MSFSGPQKCQSFDPVKAGETDTIGFNQSLDASDDVNAGTGTHLVDWEGPNDPRNPMNWSPTRKWATIALVSAITFNTYAILSRSKLVATKLITLLTARWHLP